MSRTTIFTIYIAVDLLIIAAVVWCVLQRIPASEYFLPAVALFVLNGIWLIVMTIRSVPPSDGS